MSDMPTPAPGTITWMDLTVSNADEIRDFYQKVVGWTHMPIEMGGYNDYAMMPAGSEDAVSGICHARGANADQPAQWLIYINVEDVEAAAQAAVANGGQIIAGPRGAGGGKFCVIKDPAGAVAGLYQMKV